MATAIVIQGPVRAMTHAIALHYLNNTPCTVIVSCYGADNLSAMEPCKAFGDRFHVQTSSPPPHSGALNRNSQRVTSYAGMLKAKQLGCTLALKCRSDHVFRLPNFTSHLEDLVAKFPLKDEMAPQRKRIIVGRAGTTLEEQWGRFHITDFWLFGDVDDLISYFDIGNARWKSNAPTSFDGPLMSPEPEFCQLWMLKNGFSHATMEEMLADRFVVCDDVPLGYVMAKNFTTNMSSLSTDWVSWCDPKTVSFSTWAAICEARKNGAYARPKIKVFIVTFKRPEAINKNLETLWRGASKSDDIQVTVLSNHPDIKISPANRRPNLKVIINSTRPEGCNAYLSRDWNFGIIDSFKKWSNPDGLDWCVLSQDDVQWVPGWDQWLRGNKKYDLVSQPTGDQAIALNIEAVKKIGFFDERFTMLFFQEFDYFYRALLRHPGRISINDNHAGAKSAWNPVGEVLIRAHAGGGHFPPWGWEAHKNLLCSKWGNIPSYHVCENRKDFLIHASKPAFKMPTEINWYPYFWTGFNEIHKTFLQEYQNK